MPGARRQCQPGGRDGRRLQRKRPTRRGCRRLRSWLSGFLPEIRETLDDLFRVKFVTVRRVPKKR